MNAAELLKTGLTHRYHTVPGGPTQNVAAHSWGVAMIYLSIADPPSLVAVEHCLTHDSAEHYTGDVPAHAKWINPDLAAVLDAHEQRVNEANGIDYDLCEEDRKLVKVADLLELVWWSRQQIDLGNKNYTIIFNRAMSWFIDHPNIMNDKARTLLHRIAHDQL